HLERATAEAVDAAEVELDVEALARASEVLLELRADVVERTRLGVAAQIGQHLVEALALEGDPPESGLAGHEQEPADGGVDCVVVQRVLLTLPRGRSGPGSRARRRSPWTRHAACSPGSGRGCRQPAARGW